MSPTNNALRAVRIGMRLSQDEFARAVQKAGAETGYPNGASKRLVQRWESGTIKTPQPVYVRALEVATRRPIEALGFTVPFARTGKKGVSTDGHSGSTVVAAAGSTKVDPQETGMYTGIWLSRYTYYSSGRDAELVGLHYVVLLQHGSRLTIRSLPNGSLNPDSPLTMDLAVDGHVVTGTWTEETAADGYYRGAVYHGAIQMLASPTGRLMEGKWVGFGKDFEVNSGPWELVFQTADTGKRALETYSRSPSSDV